MINEYEEILELLNARRAVLERGEFGCFRARIDEVDHVIQLVEKARDDSIERFEKITGQHGGPPDGEGIGDDKPY